MGAPRTQKRPGYWAVHKWLNRKFPRAGVCDDCGATGKTEYANISGEYHRDRADYRACLRGGDSHRIS